jgi:hypothetical protein
MRSAPYAHTSQVIHRLWPTAGTEVSALLDGARDARIASLVIRSRLDHRCLLRGRLPAALAAAAPYLVSLSPRSALTQEVVAQGWGEKWGIFVRSPAILPELMRHFRQLLRVRDEAGRAFFFRFYDPRVLRGYLRSCTLAELRAAFGPVEVFSLEGEEEDTLLELSLTRSGLAERVVSLGG